MQRLFFYMKCVMLPKIYNMNISNIDQIGFDNETPAQQNIADYYAYLELKKLGYEDAELSKQFSHVMR
jgi:hypothetical protein